MRGRKLNTLFLCVSITGLGACGGGGGTGMNFIPAPPQAPPTPPPPPTVAATAPFGLTTSQQFATYGALSRSDAGAYNVKPADPSAISFRWSATSNTYEMTVPGFSPAQLSLSFPGNNERAFWAVDGSGNRLPLAVSVLLPSDTSVNLSYSSLAFYQTYPDNATNPFIYGMFAFGLPTAPGGVPVSGTGIYDAKVRGLTISNNGYEIIGDAQLTFDFAAGSLSGYMRPRLFNDWDGVDRALPQYDFKNTVYSAGSTAFSGQLAGPAGTDGSAFDGRFTGPAAQELVAGFKATYVDPFDSVTKTMGGVWLGKKQ